MDDGTSAVRRRPPPLPSTRLTRPVLIGHAEPHHHRQRAIALLVLAAVIIGIVLLVRSLSGATIKPAAAPQAGDYFAAIRRLAGHGPGSLVAYEQADQDRAVNRVLAYTPCVRVAGDQHREVALTFDDGPGPYTPQILEGLQRTGTPATFFEVGVLERYFHASTSEIVARGYPIGDHTQSHAAMGHLPAAIQQTQLLQQVAATGAWGAPFPRLFRPPYGSWNRRTLRILHKYKMLMVLWTVDTNDYRRLGADAIVHAALAGARPGAIILLHDAGGNRSETVAALPRIIRGLRRRRFTLVSVPHLLLDNPPPKNQQIASIAGTGG